MNVDKKNPFAAVVCMAWLVLPQGAAWAAPVEWGGATATTGKFQLIDGNVLLALNGGKVGSVISSGGADGDADYNFRAMDFTTIDFTPTGADAGDSVGSGTVDSVYKTLNIVYTGDVGFDAIISMSAYANGSPTGIKTGTMTIGGLTFGEEYAVQVFYNDQRNDKALTLGDGLGNSVTIQSGVLPGEQADDYGEHAIGTFTADGTSQALTMESTAGNIHVTAILVTQISRVPFPEAPAAVAAIPGNGRVSLRWDKNSQTGFETYVVKRSPVSGGPYTDLPGGSTTRENHIDMAVTNGTTYYYAVAARNNLGEESALSSEVSAAPDSSINQPNILILYIDDQNTDYGCYGNTLTHTPNIDSLAAGGIRYTRAYVANPVCSPSHTALFTGNYVTSIGCPHHRSNYIDHLPEGHGSLPQLLADAGYFTVNLSNGDIRWGASGKTDLNFDRNPDMILTAGDDPHPFQHIQDFVFNGPADSYHCDPSTMFMGGAWTNRLPGQPFFAYANIETGKAHGFGTGTTWANVNGVAVDPAAVTIPPYLADTPAWRTEIAKSLNAVSCTDFVVGKFLEGLELGGEADNTLVVFATDHGRATMRHKQWIYETGIHVPMIVRWPGHVSSGFVETNLVDVIDIAATCVGASGAMRPPKMEGLDLLNSDLSARTHLFATRDGMDGVFDRSRTVVGQRFKYIRHFYPELPFINGSYAENNLNGLGMEDDLAGLTPEQRYFLQGWKDREEFYDLSSDPFEVTNLAGNAALSEQVDAYRNMLAKWMDSTGDYRPDAHVLLGNLARNTSVQTVENACGILMEDNDGDGLSYYHELAFDLDPAVVDASMATSYTINASHEMDYTVRNLLDGVRYEVQVSTNLADWKTYTTLEGKTGGNPETVTLPGSLSVPAGKLFVRLAIPQ